MEKEEDFKELCWYCDGDYRVLEINPLISTVKEMVNFSKDFFINNLGLSEKEAEIQLKYVFVIGYNKNILEMS